MTEPGVVESMPLILDDTLPTRDDYILLLRMNITLQ